MRAILRFFQILQKFNQVLHVQYEYILHTTYLLLSMYILPWLVLLNICLKVIGIIGPATSEETDSYLSKSQPCPFIVVGYGATSTTLAKKVPVQAYQESYDFYDPYLQEFHHSIFRPGRYPVRIPPPRKNFVQVVPTDENQVKAIVQIVKQFPNSLAINIIGTSGNLSIEEWYSKRS